ncbi:hypothetical protein ACT4UM_25625 [Bacillus sp. SS-TM]
MRLKVKGRKKYVLTEILEEDVKEICTSLKCEPALKSEVGNTRIMLNSLEDVMKLESYILEQYDFVLQALHDYKENEMNAITVKELAAEFIDLYKKLEAKV